MVGTEPFGYRSRYVADLKSSMNSQTQTIELLKLLGGDTAEAVLAHLDDAQAERLRAGLRAETTVEVDQDDQRDLLDQFGRFMDFAVLAGSIDAEDASLFQPVLHRGTGESFDDDGEEDDVDEEESVVKAPVKLTGDALHDLTSLSIYQVAGALDTEQPRTVAILLSQFSYQLTADVLSLLRPEHQAAVVVELTREMEAPQVLVDRIARATLQRGLTLPTDEPDRRDRLDRLSDVLRAVPKKLRRNMMTGIEEEDQNMSQELLKKLYRFEDLMSLDSRIIQQVLGEVDGTTLTTAMFQAPTEVVDTILGNLSKRARLSIEEEMAFQSHVPESRVEAARDGVTEVIARLDQESE
jgi:flagellar motor switch protein FliG